MPEECKVSEERGPKRPWEPMKLTYLGDVVQLVLQGEPPGKGFSPVSDNVGTAGKKPPGGG